MTSADEIVAIASRAVFGKPLVVNVHRSILVEAMVDRALPSLWSWCSTDYAAFDFVHVEGARLEVKQSAARQSWFKHQVRTSRCSFDIAPRTGYWMNGVTWAAEPGRNADIYVFAHHPIDDETADHRRPDQWQFYTVPAMALPGTKRIEINAVRALAMASSFDELSERVEDVRRKLEPMTTRRDVTRPV